MKKMRLQKYLAEKGIDSRRKCEKLITQGKIKVNQVVIKKLGTCIDPDRDQVEFNHHIIQEDISKSYILLNKPKGYLCTYHDSFARPTIYDLLKDIKIKMNYAGRLDYDSEGLVLLTNDGEMIYQLTHPKKEIEKTYVVKIKGIPENKHLKMLEKGIMLSSNFTTAPCKVNLLRTNQHSSILKITIHEGKKRQIRRMFAYLNFSVIKLKRIRIGTLSLKGIKQGHYRHLMQREILALKSYYHNKIERSPCESSK